MCILNELIENICESLTGLRDSKHNIVRVHTRKIEKLGDLSFPLDSKNWFKLLGKNQIENENKEIFSYKLTKDELIARSKQWKLCVDCISVKDGNALVFLNRKRAFKLVINTVLEEGINFGSSENSELNKEICIPPESVDLTKINLTELKTYLLKNVTKNLLNFCHYKITDCESENTLNLQFTCGGHKNAITCGCVLNENCGKKNCDVTAEQFYRQRAIPMRLMAEHKYGMRITLLPGWQEIFRKFGEASVTMHLLQTKPQQATVIKLDDPAAASVRGTCFILYNCARLATLLKEFDNKVESQLYPPLPRLQDTEFDLLVEPEEWELLFVYILRFPMVIKSCISQIEKYQIAPHFLVLHLSGLASAFSLYYRRVKILTEPREHLFPVLYQRIYLLKALQHVMHNGLRLLDIEPVKQM